MKFTKIPTDTFKNIQLNAGLLMKNFDPVTAEVKNADIVGATSGGINFTATPSFTDFGDDIDNCPKNTKELKKIESWEAKMSGTFVTVTAASAKTLVAAADTETSYAKTSDTAIVEGKTYYTLESGVYTAVENPTVEDIANYYEKGAEKIVPRNDLDDSDFADIWWVGDYSEVNEDSSGETTKSAGYIAIKMTNSLSTGGFQIQSSDKSKGTFAFEFTGHYSIEAVDTVPFELYVKAGA